MAISTHQTYAIDIEDVEYLRHGDMLLLARLYKPRGSGPFPLQVDLALFEGESQGFLTQQITSPGAERAFEQLIAFVHQHIG